MTASVKRFAHRPYLQMIDVIIDHFFSCGRQAIDPKSALFVSVAGS